MNDIKIVMKEECWGSLVSSGANIGTLLNDLVYFTNVSGILEAIK